MSKQTENFINKVKGGATVLWDSYKVLPSVAIAQAALESAWEHRDLLQITITCLVSKDPMVVMLQTWTRGKYMAAFVMTSKQTLVRIQIGKHLLKIMVCF